MAGVPPKKATAFSFTTALTLQSDTKLLKANPTLAAGDAQVSKDFGAFNNLTTLPDAEPDAGYAVRVQLSATEMDADVVTVLMHDAAGAEWCDQLITILTDTATIGEIEGQTDDIGTAGAGLTAVPWNSAWDAEVQSEAADAITAASLPTAAQTADAVWDEASTGHTDAGKAGEQLWTDVDAIKAKTDLITTGTVTVASPVASGGNVTTIQGDDYDAADGRQLDWTVSSTATLTGGTVAVVIAGVDTYTGSVVDETTIRLELTAAQSAAIPVGPHRYQVIVTQSVANGSDVITLVEGTWTSNARVSE